MSDATTHRAFLGDQLREFCLTPAMVLELERKTGSGIGGIIRRVIARDFSLSEVTETIRLGLIGGDTDPQEAAALIAAYVTPRPLVESYTLALAILQTLMLGPQPVKLPKKRRPSAAVSVAPAQRVASEKL